MATYRFPDVRGGLRLGDPIRIVLREWFLGPSGPSYAYRLLADLQCQSDSQLEELRFLEGCMLRIIIDELRCGTFLLRGFNPAGEMIEPVREWFTDVTVDVEENTVCANGLRLTGVVICAPNAPRGGLPSPIGAQTTVWIDLEHYKEVAAAARDCTNSSERNAKGAAKRGPKPRICQRVTVDMLRDLDFRQDHC